MGTTTELPGLSVSAHSLVACCKSSPAALNIAALTPPPPGFNLLHDQACVLSYHARRTALSAFPYYYFGNIKATANNVKRFNM
jgi:hypothetical protein